MSRFESFAETLAGMQHHPQGHHGWGIFHQSLHDIACGAGGEALAVLLRRCWEDRSTISDAHVVTLLGIAVRDLVMRRPEIHVVFAAEADRAERAAVLRRALDDFGDELTHSVCNSSSSFTGARRFVVPQWLIARFARFHGVSDVRFLDVGTGIGLLPRQLNNRKVFEHFARDLLLDSRPLDYEPIPLSTRYGVDQHPMPTLEWVRTCFGPSDYYSVRYQELLWSLEQTAASAGLVTLEAMNALDHEQLGKYVHVHRFNAICCSFVLYQYAEEVRTRIIDSIVDNLAEPGIFVSMEPSPGLRNKGSTVTVYRADSRAGVPVLDVADGHFLGDLKARPGLEELIGPRPL